MAIPFSISLPSFSLDEWFLSAIPQHHALQRSKVALCSAAEVLGLCTTVSIQSMCSHFAAFCMQASVEFTTRFTPFTLSNFTAAISVNLTNLNLTGVPPAGLHTFQPLLLPLHPNCNPNYVLLLMSRSCESSSISPVWYQQVCAFAARFINPLTLETRPLAAAKPYLRIRKGVCGVHVQGRHSGPSIRTLRAPTHSSATTR